MPNLTLGPTIRTLSAEELEVGFTATAASGKAASAPDTPEIDSNDPDVLEVVDLLQTYSGVLLTGAPGTSKTYLAHSVATVLSENVDSRRAFAQFHPSYQYEDFMEGYRPREAEEGEESVSGFERRPGVFLALCDRATAYPEDAYVMVIDELSRGDAARVFGEALTYVEKSKRGMEFLLPSGRTASIPPNVSIIATMNPLDRGVDEVDAAFERRFAKKSMPPRVELLRDRLLGNNMSDELIDALIDWFRDINGQGQEAQIGHAYFWTATDERSLQDLWEYQVRHHVERAFRYDTGTRDRLVAKWDGMFAATEEDD